MDAVKFIKERDRMFEVAGQAPSLSYNHLKSAEEIVSEVEEWSAAHPHKTHQSVILEQFPNVCATDGVLHFCPKLFDGSVSCLSEYHLLKKCSDCRREFWMQEVD
jgi:hypothetical protein